MRSTLLIIGLVTLGAACTGGGDDATGSSESPAVPIGSVTVPPSRLTPFCQRMIELDVELSELALDEPVGDVIVAAYRDALPIVPDEIAVEFAAVLRELETGVPATLPPGSVVLPPITVPPTITVAPDGTAPSTSTVASTTAPAPTVAPAEEGDTFLEEGYLPDESPSQRVNAYIDFTCRNSQNNPGPPPTAPGGFPVATDPDEG